MMKKEQVREKLWEALEKENMVISPSHVAELTPYVRCEKDDDSISLHLCHKPGNAYEPHENEFYIKLGCIESDSLDYDASVDINDPDKFDSDDEYELELSAQFINANMESWVDMIMEGGEKNE